MPSSWSTKPAGTCPRASSCRPISPSFCCRRSAQSSTRSRTSGSSCATTGSPTASSNPTTISSTIVVRHGTSSSISLGASCPSDCANGPTGSDQWDLVLAFARRFAQRGGGMGQVLDVDARERGGEGVFGLSQRRHHHLVEQRGAGERHSVHVVGGAGGAQNIVRRDAALLAGELLAPARS